MKRFWKKKLSHAPSGRQTMLPEVSETGRTNVGDAKNLRQRNREAIERLTIFEGFDESRSSNKGERATPEKWKKISLRAGEIAMNKGKRPEEKSEWDTRRAKRELLGLQTLFYPDTPAGHVMPKTNSP